MYDIDASKYTSLTSVLERLKQGEDISIVSHETGEDITFHTLVYALFLVKGSSEGQAMLIDILRQGEIV